MGNDLNRYFIMKKYKQPISVLKCVQNAPPPKCKRLFRGTFVFIITQTFFYRRMNKQNVIAMKYNCST